MNVSKEVTISALEVTDVRFPTSDDLFGSDAVHVDPDYSCAYVVVKTNVVDLQGHGISFTIGRGTEVVVAAIHALAHHITGRTLHEIVNNFGAVHHSLTDDSQVRWIGPKKGAVHLAVAAIVNALWDLWAKEQGVPVWRLLCRLSADDIVKLIDWKWISDALSPDEVRNMLDEGAEGKEERVAQVLRQGIGAYTTGAGWLGFADDKLRALCQTHLSKGWTHFKLKVGRDLHSDVRRLEILREEIGPDGVIMIDANQTWDVSEAIEWVKKLARYNVWFIEEPTSPDDVLGHATIRKALQDVGIKVATGEMCQNVVMWKQFFQADALDIVQIDAARMGGINEVLPVLFMAKKFGKQVIPHAGGVGLCEMVQHLSIFHQVCVSKEESLTEFANSLHEHFVHPVCTNGGRYEAPLAPGYSTEMLPETVANYTFPNGPVWTQRKHNGQQ